MKVERNEWESAFFGREIYSLVFDESSCRGDDLILPPLAGEVPCEAGGRGQQAVKFEQDLANSEKPPSVSLRSITSPASGGRIIQVKISSSDTQKITFLQQNAFHFVEGEITFHLEFAKNRAEMTACIAEIATENDLPALKALVANAFPNTRFRPPYFTADENRKFYQHWIENAVKGEFDDLCLVLKQGEKLQGAVSVRCRESVAKLGLLAVVPEFQRQSIGTKLLAAAIAWAQAQHAKHLEITTQMSNIAAIQLYQSAGAKIAATNYWFYR